MTPEPVPALTVPTVPVDVAGIVPDPGPAQALVDQILGHLGAIAGLVWETRPLLAVVAFGLGFLAALLYRQRDHFHH